MAHHLNAHLWQNVGVLSQATFTHPKTGKTQRLCDQGGSLWLRVLGVVMNSAGEADRCYYAGMRWLCKAANTNLEGAYLWLQVYEQLGWLTPNGTRPPEAGRRGKPCKQWLVTLPNLPPLVQDLWQEKPKAAPPTVAPVVHLNTERPQSKTKRVGAPATLTAQIGNVVAQVAPAVAQVEVEPKRAYLWSDATEALLVQAEVCVLKQAQAQGATEAQVAVVVAQAKTGWRTRPNSGLSPAVQVDLATSAGTCSDTVALKWLASGVCNRQTLKAYVGGGQGN
jgi:hypothetical protein